LQRFIASCHWQVGCYGVLKEWRREKPPLAQDPAQPRGGVRQKQIAMRVVATRLSTTLDLMTASCSISVGVREAGILTSERCESGHLLRGLAALAVAWFHFINGQPAFLQQHSFLQLSGAYGYLGVAAFFVISGFAIPYSLDVMKYRFPDDISKFLQRRFWRLYPAYIAARALALKPSTHLRRTLMANAGWLTT
jgi:hypothetical protein